MPAVNEELLQVKIYPVTDIPSLNKAVASIETQLKKLGEIAKKNKDGAIAGTTKEGKAYKKLSAQLENFGRIRSTVSQAFLHSQKRELKSIKEVSLTQSGAFKQFLKFDAITEAAIKKSIKRNNDKVASVTKVKNAEKALNVLTEKQIKLKERLTARERAASSGFNKMLNLSKQRINVSKAEVAVEKRAAEILERKTKELNKNTSAMSRNTSAKRRSAARGTGTGNGREGFAETMFDGAGTTFGHKIATTAQYAAAGSGIYAVAGAFREAGAESVRYDNALYENMAVLEATREEAEKLAIAARETAKAYGGSIQELDDIVLLLGRAGVQLSDLSAATTLVAQMATITGDSFEDTSKVVSSFTTVFKDAGYTVERLGSLLAYAANESKMATEDLGTFANYGLQSAKTLGLTAEQVLALATAFSNMGVNASTIGTRMQKLELIFNSTQGSITKFWRGMGQDQKEVARAIKSGGEEGEKALMSFYESIATMPYEDFMKSISGMEIRTAQLLQTIRNSHEKIKEHTEGLQSGGVDVATQAGIAALSAERLWQRSVASITTSMDGLVTKFLDVSLGRKELTKAFEEGDEAFAKAKLELLNNRFDALSATMEDFITVASVPMAAIGSTISQVAESTLVLYGALEDTFAIMTTGSADSGGLGIFTSSLLGIAALFETLTFSLHNITTVISKMIESGFRPGGSAIANMAATYKTFSGDMLQELNAEILKVETLEETLIRLHKTMANRPKSKKDTTIEGGTSELNLPRYEKGKLLYILSETEMNSIAKYQEALERLNVVSEDSLETAQAQYDTVKDQYELLLKAEPTAKREVNLARLAKELRDYEIKLMKAKLTYQNKLSREARAELALERSRLDLLVAQAKVEGKDLTKATILKQEKDLIIKSISAQLASGKITKDSTEYNKLKTKELLKQVEIQKEELRIADAHTKFLIEMKRLTDIGSGVVATPIETSQGKLGALAKEYQALDDITKKEAVLLQIKAEQNTLQNLRAEEVLDAQFRAYDNQLAMLDAQLAINDATLGWTDNLSGSAAALADVGKAFMATSNVSLTTKQDEIELEKQFLKDIKQTGLTSEEQAEIGAKYQKDKAALEKQSTDDQLQGYSMIAGAMVGMFEEGSRAGLAFVAVQQAIATVGAVGALIEAWRTTTATAYEKVAHVVMVAAALSSLLSSIGAASAGGGGSMSTSETLAARSESIKNDYSPITDRLDRQIELMEALDQKGTAARIDIEKKPIEYEAAYASYVQKTLSEATLKRAYGWYPSDEEFQASMENIALSATRLGFEAMVMPTLVTQADIDVQDSAYKQDDLGTYKRTDAYVDTDVLSEGDNFLRIMEDVAKGNTEWAFLFDAGWQDSALGPFEFGVQQSKLALSELQDQLHDWTIGVLESIDVFKDVSSTLKESYDSLTDSSYFANKQQDEAFKAIDKLRGKESYAEYVANQAFLIDGALATLSEEDIRVLYSESSDDFVAQTEVLGRLSSTLSITAEATEDLINNMDNLAIIVEAISASTANIVSWNASHDTADEAAQKLADALGITLAGTFEDLDILAQQLADSNSLLTDEELAFLDANEEFLARLAEAGINEDIETKETEKEALEEYLATIMSAISALEGVLGSLADIIERLRDAAIGTEYTMQRYYNSMAETLELSASTNYEEFVDSLKDTIDRAAILLDAQYFGTEREQEFAQKLAANQFEMMEGTALDQIDYLRMIEENTREQIDTLILLIKALGEDISTIREYTPIEDPNVETTDPDELAARNAFKNVLHRDIMSDAGLSFWTEKAGEYDFSTLMNEIAVGAIMYSGPDVEGLSGADLYGDRRDGMTWLESMGMPIPDMPGFNSLTPKEREYLQSISGGEANHASLYGYRLGGYTGNIPEDQVAGVVHGKELVINAPTVRELGLNNNNGGVFKEMLDELKELKEEVRGLQTINEDVARSSRRTSNAIESVEAGRTTFKTEVE